MTQLETLDVRDSKVTDAGLAHLKGLTQIRSLFLGRTQVSGQGLIHLKGMTQLRSLSLNYTNVSESGLVHLKGLRAMAANGHIMNDLPDDVFPVTYSLKDLSYALKLAEDGGVDAAGARVVEQRFKDAIEAGYGDLYGPVIYKVIDK